MREKDSRILVCDEENQCQYFSRQLLTDHGTHARCIISRHVSPGAFRLPHMHGFFELELILEGHGIHRLNAGEYPLSPGEMYLIRPGDVHQYVYRDEPILICCLQFDASVILPSLVSEASLAEPPLRCNAGADLEALAGGVRMLRSDAEEGSEYYDALLRCQIEILTRYLLHHVPHGTVSYAPLVRDVLAAISIRYYKKLTLESLARQMEVSPEHLGRVFREEVGCGISEYINTFRLRIAVNLMRSTRYTLRQISAESGYVSYRHFSREFVRHYGMAPAEYRRSISG